MANIALFRPVARVATTLLSMGQIGHPILNIENEKEGFVTVISISRGTKVANYFRLVLG